MRLKAVLQKLEGGEEEAPSCLTRLKCSESGGVSIQCSDARSGRGLFRSRPDRRAD